MPLVYIAICRSTGKCYVGATSKTLRERKEQHQVCALNGSPYKFHKALRDQGLSSFDWRELARPESMAQAFAMERSYAERHNSFRAGYNSTPGGAGSAADGERARVKLPIRPSYSKPKRLLWRR